MLLRIAAFELRYILRSPLAWFLCVVFFALGILAFGYMAGEGSSDLFRLGRNVNFNAPFYIAVELVLISLAGLFVAPVFVGQAIIRDRECNFEGIVFTTPVSKFNYLYGRFIGGFIALLIVFLAAPLGVILSPVIAFGVPQGSLGSFGIGHYVLAVLFYALPSLLLFSSLVFVVAVIARRMIYTHLLTIAMAFMLLVGMGVIARWRLLSPTTLSLIDPTLLRLLTDLPSYWTPEQLNTTLLATDARGSALLMNRALMMVLAFAFLGLAHQLFSFSRHAARARQTVERRDTLDVAVPPPPTAGIRRSPAWSNGIALRQFLLRTGFEFRAVFLSLPFLLLMLINLGLMLDRLPYAASVSILETHVVLNVLRGGDLAVFLVLAVMIFSPEIIWREHRSRFHEVIHTLPASNWMFVASKLLALVCVLGAVLLMNVALAMFFQLGDGNIDFGLYLRQCLFLFVPFACFAVLASFLQISANNHFAGTGLTVSYLAVTLALYVFGFQHPLYQNFWFADSTLPLSGMDSDSDFQARGYWLRAFWLGITGMVLLLTFSFFSRGVLQPLKYRLNNLSHFRTPRFYLPAAASLLLTLSAGSFIYYNTNVLNPYISGRELEARFAEYEKLYRQYENLPMPKITDIDLELTMFPDARRLEFGAALTLINKSAQPIDAVHLELPFGIDFTSLTVAGGTLRSADPVHRYNIYELAVPMAPGEERVVSMNGIKQLRGFRATNEDTTLVDNGTYFEIATIIPHIGFSLGRLLVDAQTRQEYGLDPSLPLGTLDEDPATSPNFNTTALRTDSELVNFTATLSTDAGQTAVTAGRLLEQWNDNGRSYFRYRSDVPIYPVIPFFSARYAVLRDSWRNPETGADVDIEIFYHPEHGYHLDVMMQGLKDGLAAYGSAYGPYQYRQLRVMEYPGYRTNSRSLPTTIAHSEANGFVARDPAENYESMAHELAHHWWGHQIISARVEGGGVLGEGFASYSARMLMDAKYGKEFTLHRSFISSNRRYLRGRNNDRLGERPLNRTVGQSYLDYSKGESVMYALQNYLGESAVNAALHEFFSTYKGSTHPFVVSTNFIDILKRTAGPEHRGLVEDLFEKIALYEFSVDAAQVEALPDGRYRVTLDIGTSKIYADESGKETAAEFDSVVDIGLFTRHPLDRRFRFDEDVVHVELQSPRNGKSSVEFIVERQPLFAGINPYDILIERDSTNNVRSVTPTLP